MEGHPKSSEIGLTRPQRQPRTRDRQNSYAFQTKTLSLMEINMKSPSVHIKSTAPAHLSDPSKTLWDRVVSSNVLCPSRLVLLTLALECLDRLSQIRLILKDSGKLTSITTKTGAIHLNPLVKAEMECRTQFIELWRRLDIKTEPNSPTFSTDIETR